MEAIIQRVIFLVGLGAPASLYANYLDDLKKRLPQTNIVALEWWNQADFGVNALQSEINNSEVMLIGHSGGSVLALQALATMPGLVKRIIMLDSHFLHTRNALPTVSRALDIMLSQSSSSVAKQVKNAYLPLINHDVM